MNKASLKSVVSYTPLFLIQDEVIDSHQKEEIILRLEHRNDPITLSSTITDCKEMMVRDFGYLRVPEADRGRNSDYSGTSPNACLSYRYSAQEQLPASPQQKRGDDTSVTMCAQTEPKECYKYFNTRLSHQISTEQNRTDSAIAREVRALDCNMPPGIEDPDKVVPQPTYEKSEKFSTQRRSSITRQ
jgi:hypothetical protein